MELDLKGCIVTVNAMGCQETIAANIIVQKAGFVLAVKDHQGRLHDDLRDFLTGYGRTVSVRLSRVSRGRR